MKFKSFVVISLLVVVGIFVITAVPAHSSEEENGRDLALIRQATARYHDLDAALADGYEILFDCTLNPQDPAQGGMGIHYINGNLAGDDILELSRPEVLMYEPQANGQMKLLGVEYIIFEEQWDQAEAPEFLGQTLKRKTAVGVHEVPPFYEVHAWVWKHNPSGMFADWNPDVTCP